MVGGEESWKKVDCLGVPLKMTSVMNGGKGRQEKDPKVLGRMNEDRR